MDAQQQHIYTVLASLCNSYDRKSTFSSAKAKVFEKKCGAFSIYLSQTYYSEIKPSDVEKAIKQIPKHLYENLFLDCCLMYELEGFPQDKQILEYIKKSMELSNDEANNIMEKARTTKEYLFNFSLVWH